MTVWCSDVIKGFVRFCPMRGHVCVCKLLVACSYDEQFIISSRGWMHGLAVIHQRRHCLSMVIWRRDAFVTYLLGLLWSPVFPRGCSGKTRSVSANRQTASRAAQFRNGQASWMSSFTLSTSFNLQCVCVCAGVCVCVCTCGCVAVCVYACASVSVSVSVCSVSVCVHPSYTGHGGLNRQQNLSERTGRGHGSCFPSHASEAMGLGCGSTLLYLVFGLAWAL